MGEANRTAARLGMAMPSEDTQRRARAAADQIMAIFPGFTVQEATSTLCLCLGEALALLPPHDVPKALRKSLEAVALHASANSRRNRRWLDQITVEDVTVEPPGEGASHA